MSVSIATKKSEPKSKTETKYAKSPELTVIAKVIKGDTYMVMADAANELEDEFVSYYQSPNKTGGSLAVEPPFNPKILKSLVVQNNILNQCIHAMEVNIDGTGHEFVPSEEGKEVDKKEEEAATQFFDEPYPGKSFVEMRREMRRDLEGMGYGFLEVLRNLGGDVVSMRGIEGQTLRLVRLGEPVQITHKVMRGGKEVEFMVNERPRAFMQIINSQNRQYFKEFGCPLDLNRKTGEWGGEGKPAIPVADRATELLYFGVDKDTKTPYYVPRWINQLPSVVGSRKAEESNLEFFDAGGMPPAIIFIQGGGLTKDTAQQLRTYLSAANKTKGRAVVVEMASNSGTLESSGSVTAKVERFGAERANDSMYSNYDKQAEEHVRIGFRLPPIFLGKAADYNYATAVVAYQVAEAQVFQPERKEFDDRINKTIIKALGFKTLKFKSLPITMKSVEESMAGLELIDGKVNPEDFVAEVNKLIGTDIKYEEQPNPLTGLMPGEMPLDPAAMAPGTAKPAARPAAKPKAPTKKLDTLVLARRYAEVIQLAEPIVEMTEEQKAEVRERVGFLSPTERERLDEMVELFALPEDHGHAH